MRFQENLVPACCRLAAVPTAATAPDDSMQYARPCLILWPVPWGDELMKRFIYNATLVPQILHNNRLTAKGKLMRYVVRIDA